MEKIIKDLEQLREHIRTEAEEKMDSLTRTIEILRGRRPNIVDLPTMAAGIERAGAPQGMPSVRQMVEQAGEALAEGKDENDFTFTFKQVKDWVVAKWPGEEKKIRIGFYAAVNLVVQAGVWDRADNGFKIAQASK